MADDKPIQSKRGLINKTIDLIMRIIGVLMFSAVISILLEWGGIVFFYPEEGHHHSRKLMEEELQYLQGGLDLEGEASAFVKAAGDVVGSIVSFIFIDSGLVQALQDAKNGVPDDGSLAGAAQSLMASLHTYLMSAIYMMVVFFIRLSILTLSMPAFLLFGFVGVTDGLMKRDLRRWSGGVESGFIYHWAKFFSLPVLIIAWLSYLAIPRSIHPNYIITPFAILFGLVLMIMASKFKKYL